jgi:UDP-glucose:(heptosyl)LPS alpha-1,3-glucosyltransferase
LAGRLHWHGASSDVARFHAAADVFALPTTYEPFGLVIIEAMASGLPVITSGLAGAAVAIAEGNNGLLLDDPRDAEQLAQHLRALLDAGERDRVGQAAAASVADYEWQQVFTRAEKLIFPS